MNIRNTAFVRSFVQLSFSAFPFTQCFPKNTDTVPEISNPICCDVDDAGSLWAFLALVHVLSSGIQRRQKSEH